jgi:hypothetical protein
LVIESNKPGRPGDDDPTKLMVRDEAKPPAPEPVKAESVADTKADPPSVVEVPRSKAALYVFAAILLAVAAVAGLYFGGVVG